MIYVRVRDKVHWRFATPHGVIPRTDVNLKTLHLLMRVFVWYDSRGFILLNVRRE